jgi:hypothetical protein
MISEIRLLAQLIVTWMSYFMYLSSNYFIYKMRLVNSPYFLELLKQSIQ